MFEKFGEFDSVEELNRAAEGFLKENDIESLYAMAKENGIDKEDVEDYEDGCVDQLATQLNAALGRIKVMREEATGNDAFAMNTILDFIETEALTDARLQQAVMKKGKRARDIYGKLREGARKSGCACGTDRQLVEIIREYYLGSKSEFERKAKAAGGSND